jgi:hypothetical protein
MRTIALLIVLALAAPSAAALVCDVMCAAQHDDAAPQRGSCHDHAAPQRETPSVSAWHVCHAMGVVPASVVRDAASQVAVPPAIARAIVDSAAEHIPARTVNATHARLTGHAPPPAVLPLRI